MTSGVEGICIENSDFVEGIFAQIPPSPEGILKIPVGTPPGLRAGAEARGPGGVPEGFLKSPTG